MMEINTKDFVDITNITPFCATHPGEILLDAIKELKIKQTELACQISIPASNLNDIIKGKRNITPEIASKLEAVIPNVEAKFWLSLQNDYDLDTLNINKRIQEEKKAAKIWQILKSKLPISDLKKIKIITNNVLKDIEKVFEIFNVTNIDEFINIESQPNVSYFKKSEKLSIDPISVFGWTHLVYYNSKKVEVSKMFNNNSLEQVINDLNNIFFNTENKNIINQVSTCLSKYGIKFFVQKTFSKLPIDGFSFIDKEVPTIVVTCRHNKIDNLAFALMHEICHIYKHMKNNKNYTDHLSVCNDKKIQDSQEKEADKFASNSLINSQVWQNIYSNKPNHISELDHYFIRCSKREKINPAIILGRYQYEMNKYNFKTKIERKFNYE